MPPPRAAGGRWPTSPTRSEAQLAGGAEVDARRRRGLDLAAGYTWERCADSHMDAYRWAVGRTAGSGPGTDGGDR